MQRSPSEIKEKLLKALDKEYNVVDMAAVLEIVTILERTPITKEALESTRLGRDINELRRKTKNESLAKRAKDLVRRWRDMILPAGEGVGMGNVGGTAPSEVQQNGGRQQGTRLGGRPVVSPANSDRSGRTVISPPQQQCRGATVDPVPKTHAANKRLRKDVGNDSEPPNVAKKAKPPEVVVGGNPTPAPPQQRLNGDHYDSVGSDCEIVSVTPAPTTPRPKQRNRKKAPKDRTTREVTSVGGGDDIVKEKIASIARTPKVKTTQELLADLKSRSGGAGDVGRPPTVLPNDHDVARNKTEHIARFLRSTGTPSAPPDDEVDPVHQESGGSETGTERTKEEEPAPGLILESPEQILAKLPPLDVDSICWDEENDLCPAPSSPRPITSDDVEGVLNRHIEGLNGNTDHFFKDGEDNGTGVFREWHQVVSRTSYQGDLLHILPYVVID